MKNGRLPLPAELLKGQRADGGRWSPDSGLFIPRFSGEAALALSLSCDFVRIFRNTFFMED